MSNVLVVKTDKAFTAIVAHLEVKQRSARILKVTQQRTPDGRQIITNFDYPPIPIRDFDWSAVTEDYDGAEDSHCPIGHGKTEAEAIAELLDQIEERSATTPNA